MDLKRWDTGEVIYTSSLTHIEDVIVEAVNSGVALQYVNLSGADLGYIDIVGANLRSARLTAVDLSRADLQPTRMPNADLSSSICHYCNFSYCYMPYVNMNGSYMAWADFSYCDLRESSLLKTTLTNTNLTYANLRRADLSGANCSYADLSYADLRGANTGYTNFNNANLNYTLTGELLFSSSIPMLQFKLILPPKSAADVVKKEITVIIAGNRPIVASVPADQLELYHDLFECIDDTVVKTMLVQVDDSGNRSKKHIQVFTLSENMSAPKYGEVGISIINRK